LAIGNGLKPGLNLDFHPQEFLNRAVSHPQEFLNRFEYALPVKTGVRIEPGSAVCP